MKAKITKEMMLGEIINKNPKFAEIMMKHGLHCIGCGVSAFESLEQGAMAHGLGEKEIKEIVDEKNVGEKKSVKK